MSPPIIAIDHLRVQVLDLETAVADYRLLLGTDESWRGQVDDQAWAVFETANLALCLVESTQEAGLCGICFRVDSQERLRRRLKNVNLPVIADSITDPLQALFANASNSNLDRLDGSAARGLEISFIARPGARAFNGSAAILGLDHVVIGSGDGDATALLLGARLGLDMRMDLSRDDWNARLLFFRCGDLIVEVFQRLDGEHNTDEDWFYGLSWRVADATVERERLAASGFDVSDVRQGRKPGTRVFTARDRTGGVATLILEPPGNR